ncbi:MAG: tetratricopeptide repeat protein [Myxococcales bacterium]
MVRFSALAVALGLCVSFARHQWLGRAVDAPALVAERMPVAPPPIAHAEPAPSSSGLERRIPPASSVLPRARLAARTVANTAPQRVDPVTDSTCRSWANQGQVEHAVECFRSIAREPGLPAQVALYEAARLAADALHDSERALRLIDQHQERFPDSALRIEVEWLRIRCLEHSGRLDEALSASETLLDSAAGRPLAARLHLLRGRIYQSARSDCGHALPEYVALLGEPGTAGSDAELRRAECLEQLQRPAEARAAYQHYLERGDARDAERARSRLLVLSAPASTEGPP